VLALADLYSTDIVVEHGPAVVSDGLEGVCCESIAWGVEYVWYSGALCIGGAGSRRTFVTWVQTGSNRNRTGHKLKDRRIRHASRSSPKLTKDPGHSFLHVHRSASGTSAIT